MTRQWIAWLVAFVIWLALVGALLAQPLTAWAVTTSLLPTLQELRPLFPTPMTPDQLSALLNQTVRQHPGWALLRKESGNNCPTPSGKRISCDWIVNIAERWGYDVLIARETVAIPTWGGGAALSPESEIVLPWDDQIPTPPLPPNPPAPLPSLDLAPLHAKIDGIRDSLEDHRAEVRKTRNQVMAFLTNWRNLVKVGSGVIAGIIGSR
jgi:hypothetical protein